MPERKKFAPPAIQEFAPKLAEVTEFSERACLRGGLGQFEAKHLMLLAMAHAGRFGKYGA